MRKRVASWPVLCAQLPYGCEYDCNDGEGRTADLRGNVLMSAMRMPMFKRRSYGMNTVADARKVLRKPTFGPYLRKRYGRHAVQELSRLLGFCAASAGLLCVCVCCWPSRGSNLRVVRWLLVLAIWAILSTTYLRQLKHSKHPPGVPSRVKLAGCGGQGGGTLGRGRLAAISGSAITAADLLPPPAAAAPPTPPDAPPPPNGGCIARGDEEVRVALCLYGLFRGLDLTIEGLRENVIGQIRAHPGTALDVFVHAMQVERLVSSPSSAAEAAEDDRPQSEHAADVEAEYWRAPQRAQLGLVDYLQLAPCRFIAEDQGVADVRKYGIWSSTGPRPHWAASNIVSKAAQVARWAARARGRGRGAGASYSPRAIHNVFRAWYSLSEVAKLAQAHERAHGFNYTHVVAARPDTAFLTPLRWSTPGGSHPARARATASAAHTQPTLACALPVDSRRLATAAVCALY